MNHPAIQAQLLALHDEEVPKATRRALEAHLAQCAECRILVARWQRITRALFPTPDIKTSEDFVDRVLDRVAAAQPLRAAWWPTVPWLVPAFGLALVVFVFLGSMRQPISIEALLLEEGRERGATHLMLASEAPSVDVMLDAILEGGP